MASPDTIMAKLQEVLSETLGHPVALQDSTDIQTDLELTSADLMDAIGRLEDSLDILIPLNELTGVRTAGELVAVIAKSGG